MSSDPKTKSIRLSAEMGSTDEASAALRALVELFEKVKGPGPYRRYVLECLEGELVFRQPELLRHKQTPVT